MKRGPKTNIKKLDHKPKRAKSITYDDFIDACETGNLEVVEKGIIALTVEVITSNRNRALRRAAKNGHLEIVTRLLRIDEVSQTAPSLSMNLYEGRELHPHHRALILLLISMNRRIKDSEQALAAEGLDTTALRWLAHYGYPVMNRLLEIDAFREEAERNQCELLCVAAFHGDLLFLNRLLEIDAIRKYAAGLTLCNRVRKNYPLFFAAQEGHLSVVKRLLEIDEFRDYEEDLLDVLKWDFLLKFFYTGLGHVFSVARNLVLGNAQIDPIETVLKKLAEKYPDLKINLEKENRKNEARALYFAYRAAKSKPACSQSMLKKYGQRDTVVKIMQMVLNSPPPAQQLDEPLTKKLR